MSGYRFCRSDDVPLLCRAYNECFQVHFPERTPMTTERFKRAVREIDLWTSSCMVAFDGEQPIAVVFAAKRESENLLLAVGTHPRHQRQGHGRHMLDSLSQKMAILGPPRLTAEVRADEPLSRSFIEACGYEVEASYTDYLRPAATANVEPHELVQPISVDELLDSGAFDREATRCWERAERTLRNRREKLQGLAVASDERIEAHLLYDDEAGDERRIVAFGAHDPAKAEALLGLLFRQCCGETEQPVRIPGVAPDEIDRSQIDRWGFRPLHETLTYATNAVPG